MTNQIERDVYVLSDRIENPISYVRATNAVPIVFHFRDYDIPDGATAQVFVNKPSGLAVYNSATISGNSVIVDTTMQMFAELGISEMQVQISNGGDNLVTFSCPVKVAPNYIEFPSSQNESSLYDDIQDAISDAEAATTAANQAAEAVAEAVGGVINDNQVSDLTTYSSEKIDEDFLKKAGDVATGNLTIHKNDPYLLLENSGGGDDKVGLHYYGSSAGNNIFEIHDNTNAQHLMTISEATKEAKFYGTVSAGEKAKMFTDAEGGNFELYSSNGSVRWQVDAYNNKVLRVFALIDGAYTTFYFNNDGDFINGNGVSLNAVANNISKLPLKTNLLDVSRTNATDSKNWTHRVATADASTLTNSPVTSGEFYAKWECIYLSSTRVLVKITEFAPKVGRFWFNRYGGSAWSGWVSNI